MKRVLSALLVLLLIVSLSIVPALATGGNGTGGGNGGGNGKSPPHQLDVASEYGQISDDNHRFLSSLSPAKVGIISQTAKDNR